MGSAHGELCFESSELSAGASDGLMSTQDDLSPTFGIHFMFVSIVSNIGAMFSNTIMDSISCNLASINRGFASQEICTGDLFYGVLRWGRPYMEGHASLLGGCNWGGHSLWRTRPW